MLLPLTAAVLVGGCVALQQRVNGELEQAVSDPLLVGLVGFATCLALSAAVVLARPDSRRALPAVRGLPPWQLLGGLGGATLVAVGAVAAPELGVALLTVGIVFGQTAGAVAVDRYGVGPGGRRPLTAARGAGALLCLLAVAVSALGGDARRADPALLGLVVLAGVGACLQQALNGRVTETTGDARLATLTNYVAGTVGLLLGFTVHAVLGGVRLGHWPGPGRWYLYTGGPLGACFVAVAALIVQRLGVLLLGLATTAGQLAGAVTLDLVVPAPGRSLSLLTVAGVVLTFAAVLVTGRPDRARQPAPVR